MPIIGDFHYNGHILLKKYPDCAQALAKYRINPGNVNIGKKHDDNFRTMIEAAIEYDRPVRIGVNWGSLDQALLTRMMDENSRLTEPLDAKEVTMNAIVASALHSAQAAENYGLGRDKIILSAKVSGVQDLIHVYRKLAAQCDYALHLGLTEAGLGSKGIVATTAALSVLLQEGIGVVPTRLLSASKSFKLWSCAASRLKSLPALAAGAPPAPFSRTWPTRSRLTCASRCRSGKASTRAWKR